MKAVILIWVHSDSNQPMTREEVAGLFNKHHR